MFCFLTLTLHLWTQDLQQPRSSLNPDFDTIRVLYMKQTDHLSAHQNRTSGWGFIQQKSLTHIPETRLNLFHCVPLFSVRAFLVVIIIGDYFNENRAIFSGYNEESIPFYFAYQLWPYCLELECIFKLSCK